MANILRISGPPRSRSSKVTLPDLLDFRTRSGGHINVIQRIGVNYRHLVIFLLNDGNGDIVDSIGANHRLIETDHRLIETRLLQWLVGNETSWGTLVTVLRMIRLNKLAKDIADNLGKLVKYYIVTNTKWCSEMRRKEVAIQKKIDLTGMWQ